MCFCTQGSLMWMSVGVHLDHECIMVQRNAPCVCVCVCVYSEFVKMEMGIPCYALLRKTTASAQPLLRTK